MPDVQIQFVDREDHQPLPRFLSQVRAIPSPVPAMTRSNIIVPSRGIPPAEPIECEPVIADVVKLYEGWLNERE